MATASKTLMAVDECCELAVGPGDTRAQLTLCGDHCGLEGVIEATADGTTWVEIASLDLGTNCWCTGPQCCPDDVAIMLAVDCSLVNAVRFKVLEIASGEVHACWNSGSVAAPAPGAKVERLKAREKKKTTAAVTAPTVAEAPHAKKHK